MNIKELRKEKGLNQFAFADSIGVSRNTIAAYETDRLAISEKVAGRIREVYGVEVDAIEVKKPAARAAAKTAEKKAAAHSGKKLVKKVSTPKLEIYIQSPLGGNITPEEIAAKMPDGTEACFVRVDQNLIWWVRGDGETGAVEIW
jgi:transcriptional regulator with XRE-family HTH domain